MNTIPAQEIKRRGIAAVDDLIAKGPVHVIRNNQPQYVVMTQQRYEDLIEAEDEAYEARVLASLEDLKAGRVVCAVSRCRRDVAGYRHRG